MIMFKPHAMNKTPEKFQKDQNKTLRSCTDEVLTHCMYEQMEGLADRWVDEQMDKLI